MRTPWSRQFGILLVCLIASGCGPSAESRGTIRRLHSSNVVDRLKAIAETQVHADAAVLGGHRDPRLVPSAIRQLPASILSIGKPDPSRLDPYKLGQALVAYGPDALPAVGALLRDPRKEIVAWAIMHHGSYPRSDRALEVLARYLDDRDVIYRRPRLASRCSTIRGPRS